jgi:hypothetical protein
MGPRPIKSDEDISGADPLVRVGPPDPLFAFLSISSTKPTGARRLRTRGSAPPTSLP